MSAPLVARSSVDTNLAAFDGWTLVHVAWGLGAGGLGLGPWWFLGLTGLYELLEFAHEYPNGSAVFGTKRPESAENLVADVGVAALGYALARVAREKITQ